MAFQQTLFIVLLGCAFTFGSPIRFEDSSISAEEMPELLTVPDTFGLDYVDENLPRLYLILLGDIANGPQNLSSEKSSDPSALVLQKRDVESREVDDLETAAGTNVLRPLFVYRQQIAYRQRLRNDRRRRYRF